MGRSQIAATVAVVVVALSLAACTSQGGVKQRAGTGTTTPSAPVSPATASPSTATSGAASSASATGDALSAAPSHAELEAANVQLGDLPHGWRQSAPPTDRASGEAQLAACEGTTLPGGLIERVFSPNFTKGADLLVEQVSSRAVSFASQDALGAHIALLRYPDLKRCVTETMTGAGGGAVTRVTARIDPNPTAVAPNVIAVVRTVIAGKDNGATYTAFLDTAFVTGPQLLVQVSFDAIAKPVGPALEIAVIRKVAARAAG